MHVRVHMLCNRIESNDFVTVHFHYKTVPAKVHTLHFQELLKRKSFKLQPLTLVSTELTSPDSEQRYVTSYTGDEKAARLM